MNRDREGSVVACEQIERSHLAGVLRLCEIECWSSYTEDAEATWRALTAPGVTTIVATENEDVVGFAQVQSDGLIQAHLSVVLVARDHRRRGIATRLVRDSFRTAGGRRVDLVTRDAPGFYRSFVHKEWLGFRIYPFKLLYAMYTAPYQVCLRQPSRLPRFRGDRLTLNSRSTLLTKSSLPTGDPFIVPRRTISVSATSSPVSHRRQSSTTPPMGKAFSTRSSCLKPQCAGALDQR
ncbi:MAG: GNAT family N-acetyltransferase [Planctomycetota bacterium]|jgi:ribosomal protein S18 acetylase RimI-like enzyme